MNEILVYISDGRPDREKAYFRSTGPNQTKRKYSGCIGAGEPRPKPCWSSPGWARTEGHCPHWARKDTGRDSYWCWEARASGQRLGLPKVESWKAGLPGETQIHGVAQDPVLVSEWWQIIRPPSCFCPSNFHQYLLSTNPTKGYKKTGKSSYRE